MTSASTDAVTLTVTLLRDEPLSLLVANDLRPKGEFIPRGLLIDIGREASDGTTTITIARGLAESRGLIDRQYRKSGLS